MTSSPSVAMRDLDVALHPEAHIPAPYPGEILRGLVGSGTHGLAVPGTDDVDLMGCRFESMGEVAGLDPPFEQHIYRSAGGSNPSRPGDVDLVVYGMRKFLRLLLDGNPTMLNLLFVPAESLTICTEDGLGLRALAPSIVSAQAGVRYLGYAEQQRQRMLGLRGQKRSGKIRQELVDAHGFDTKYAMHIVRLGLQGCELLETGHITLPMPDPARSIVYAIRCGEVPQPEVLALAEDNERRLKALIADPLIRPRPDRDVVERWLLERYRERWA